VNAFPTTFSGVVAAAVTPFGANGQLDLHRVGPLADFLIASGVSGVLVAGTTGEFVTLTSDERMTLFREFTTTVARRVPVIAHIGHAYVAEACRLAERAAAAGVQALAALTPYFYRTSAAAIEQYMRDIMRAVPELPFFIYNYPEAAGNPFTRAIFESLRSEPNLAGIKLTVATFAEVEPYLPLVNDLCIMNGNDALLVAFARSGGRAVVSGNATADPKTIVSLLDAVKRRDDVAVREYEAKLACLRQLSADGAPDRLKDILRQHGIDMGVSRVRTDIVAG
jgi:N-acetylneuraminate lyase